MEKERGVGVDAKDGTGSREDDRRQFDDIIQFLCELALITYGYCWFHRSGESTSKLGVELRPADVIGRAEVELDTQLGFDGNLTVIRGVPFTAYGEIQVYEIDTFGISPSHLFGIPASEAAPDITLWVNGNIFDGDELLEHFARIGDIMAMNTCYVIVGYIRFNLVHNTTEALIRIIYRFTWLVGRYTNENIANLGYQILWQIIETLIPQHYSLTLFISA